MGKTSSPDVSSQPTLESLTGKYQIIVWKHCYTAAGMQADSGQASVGSQQQTPATYQLQYEALKKRMNEFPDTRFIVWTVPPQAQQVSNPEQAERTKEFARWVREDWDVKGDNIYVFDYWSLASDGTFLRADYAAGPTDSHPSQALAQRAAKALAARITDVGLGQGDSRPSTGE